MSNYDGSDLLASCTKKLTIVAFAVGVALGGGMRHGTEALEPMGNDSRLPVICENRVTLTDYERIQPGMTLFEVRSILGPGDEVSQSEGEMTQEWTNADNSKITAIFNDGLLQKKSQKNLRRK